MKTQPIFHCSKSLAVLLAFLLLPACSPTPTPTPFIPPKAATATLNVIQGNTPIIPTFTPQSVVTPNPTPTPPCTDGLAFLKDLTISDGAIVKPGERVDKQWQVQNNGSCNWDSRYRLKFVGGLDLGATLDQALYPARAGTLAVIRIIFTAPNEPGTYNTAWQALNPEGEPFGDAVFMEILVQEEADVTIEVVE